MHRAGLLDRLYDYPRTDPWLWYCRICGATGEAEIATDRDAAAMVHLRECSCADAPILATAEYGHLLHVWRYRLGAPVGPVEPSGVLGGVEGPSSPVSPPYPPSGAAEHG